LLYFTRCLRPTASIAILCTLLSYMSSYNHARLAGLDAMVLHFSNSNSSLDQSTVLNDGIPYVTISRTTKNNGPIRRARTPLGDRTSDFNITPSSTANFCNYTLSTQQETSKEPRHTSTSRPKPFRTSTSFHPLPPVPSSSSLQLPSFSNFIFSSNPPTPSHNTRPPTPIPPSLLSLGHTDVTLPPQTNADEYHIPAYQHPNSPYVPWAPPIRREILCPPTFVSHASFISSEYTRSYSRSGARAPEPVEPSISDQPCTQAPKTSTWRCLGQALKKNAKHVAKCITSLTNPFKAAASHISAPPSSGSRVRERNVLRKQISRPPQPDKELQTSAVRPPSIASVGSCETTTLATWLASRRRMSLEGDYDPQMSLDEYERMGSWISLARAETVIESSCGVPGCRLHLHPFTRIRSFQDQTTPIRATQSPQSRSFPRLHSLSRDEDAKASLGREMSMPGGWAF